MVNKLMVKDFVKYGATWNSCWAYEENQVLQEKDALEATNVLSVTDLFDYNC